MVYELCVCNLCMFLAGFEASTLQRIKQIVFYSYIGVHMLPGSYIEVPGQVDVVLLVARLGS